MPISLVCFLFRGKRRWRGHVLVLPPLLSADDIIASGPKKRPRFLATCEIYSADSNDPQTCKKNRTIRLRRVIFIMLFSNDELRYNTYITIK